MTPFAFCSPRFWLTAYRYAYPFCLRQVNPSNRTVWWRTGEGTVGKIRVENKKERSGGDELHRMRVPQPSPTHLTSYLTVLSTLLFVTKYLNISVASITELVDYVRTSLDHINSVYQTQARSNAATEALSIYYRSATNEAG